MYCLRATAVASLAVLAASGSAFRIAVTGAISLPSSSPGRNPRARAAATISARTARIPFFPDFVVPLDFAGSAGFSCIFSRFGAGFVSGSGIDSSAGAGVGAWAAAAGALSTGLTAGAVSSVTAGAASVAVPQERQNLEPGLSGEPQFPQKFAIFCPPPI